MDAQSRHAKVGGPACASTGTSSRSITPLLGVGGVGSGGAALNHPNNQVLKCPRCDSFNTKFCYYNNYSLLQPRHFCKNCRRYWTKGGALRNVPVGGGCRKTKRSAPPAGGAAAAGASLISNSTSGTAAAAAAMLTCAPPKRVMNIMMADNSASNTTSGYSTTHLIAPVQDRPQYFSDLNLQPSPAAAALQSNLSPTSNSYYKLYTAGSKTSLIQPSSSSINPSFSSCAQLSAQYSNIMQHLNAPSPACFSPILPHNPIRVSSSATPHNHVALPANVNLTSSFRSAAAAAHGSAALFGQINESNISANDAACTDPTKMTSSSTREHMLTSAGDFTQRRNVMAITSSSTPTPTLFSTENTVTSHAGNLLNSLALAAMNEGSFARSGCRPDQWMNSRISLMQADHETNKEMGSVMRSSGQLRDTELQHLQYCSLQDQMTTLTAPDVEEGAAVQSSSATLIRTELVSDNFNNMKGSGFGAESRSAGAGAINGMSSWVGASPDVDGDHRAGHSFLEPSGDETTYWNSCNPSPAAWPDNLSS